jgi:hypothetical protein
VSSAGRAGAPTLPGLAHVASCSFLAARLVPSGHFWVALAGGIALARAGERHGLRAGYGASLSAVLQTVALIGPARVNGPLTQALNAPVIGRLQGRGASRLARLAACLGIRLVHYAVVNLVFVLVVVGGVDAYVATYDKIAEFTRVLPTGATAAFVLTVVGAIGWGTFYSTVQVLAYERALARWPAEPEPGGEPHAAPGEARRVPRRTVAILLAVAAAWVALLANTDPLVLAIVAGALTVAWLVTWTFPRDVVVVGFSLAAALAVGALLPAVIGAVDFDDAARRAARVVLLVLTATWARAAIGAPGLRRAAHRGLWRARRLPSVAEAADITARLESDTRLADAGRALVDQMRDVPQRPLPVADALTAWVAGEAAAYEAP